MAQTKLIHFFLLFSLLALAQEKKYDPQITQVNYNNLDWSKAYFAEVKINKPITEVWDYVSDSSHAVNWSVYFHHISSLPGLVADGKIGSLRRCFRYKNEKGAAWDEEVLNVTPERNRLILSFHFKGFYLENQSYTTYVLQSYTKVDENTTLLRFQTMPTPAMTFIDRFVFFFAKNQVEAIFKLNLENIKSQIETRTRLHNYDSENYRFFEK